MKSYLKLLSGILMIIFNLSSCLAQNNNKSALSIIWKKSQSPIIIDSCFTVEKYQILKIESGVVVKFKSSTEKKDFWKDSLKIGMLKIYGKLIAIGTLNEPILFTREDTIGNWGAIVFFDSKKENVLKHCQIEYGSYIQIIKNNPNPGMPYPISSYDGAVSFINSDAMLSDCIINNNASNGVTVYGKSPYYADHENKTGVKGDSNPRIFHCTIVNNKYSGLNYMSNTLISIKSSVFWNNSDAYNGSGNYHSNISYSLIQGTRFSKEYESIGHNILNINPLFKDIEHSDFRLNEGSPCIGNGDNGSDIGAIPFKFKEKSK